MPAARLAAVRRRVLNLLTILSLLLCAAVVVLWVRSQRVMDRWVLNSTRHYVEVNARRGGVWLLWISTPTSGPLWLTWEHESRQPLPLVRRPYRWWHPGRLYFDHTTQSGRPGTVTRSATVPYWLLVTPMGVVSGLWVLATSRRRRLRRSGLCPACGYDLTGNVSGVCPECGTAMR